ncbi:MAG: hypothetical protein IPK28_22485 [Devosia sp.]|nr:hypothetical protein [Devosia sp.]
MRHRFVAVALALALSMPSGAALAQFMDINTIISEIGTVKYYRMAERAASASGLRVVRLSSLAAAARSADRLHTSVVLQRRAVRELQESLALNPVARIAIRNAGLEIEDIVSAEIAGDGGGVLYADDL